MTKVKNFPWHLILIAILPIISLYANNIEDVVFSNTLRAYAFSFLFAMVLFTILMLVIRNAFCSALIISYGLLLFYALSPLKNTLFSNGMIELSRYRYLVPFLVFVFFAGVWIGFKTIDDLEYMTKVFNMIAFSTLILPIFQISFFIVFTGAPQDIPFDDVKFDLSERNDIKKLFPDVYLIVLDAHGRSDDIKRELGYDNAKNLEKLTSMGFYIASCSNANYPD